jgi:hypothetical protein
MRYFNRKHIGLAAVAIAFAAAPAFAQGKGHGKGNKGHDRDHDRDGRVVIIDNGNVGRVPPGLAKKPGQMPPGQYKKRYTALQGVGYLRESFSRHGYTVVRTSPYGESQYVYYRAPNGTLQRAIVYPGNTQLGFTNVPSLILQEVLARLY